MFSQVFVCPQRACMAGTGMFGGEGHAWQEGMHGRKACTVRGVHDGGHAWQGVCMAGGVHGRGHVWHGGGVCGRGVCAEEMATEVGGTHPTGMHSCWNLHDVVLGFRHCENTLSRENC